MLPVVVVGQSGPLGVVQCVLLWWLDRLGCDTSIETPESYKKYGVEEKQVGEFFNEVLDRDEAENKNVDVVSPAG